MSPLKCSAYEDQKNSTLNSGLQLSFHILACFVFETGFHYAILASLEITLFTRLALNSPSSASWVMPSPPLAFKNVFTDVCEYWGQVACMHLSVEVRGQCARAHSDLPLWESWGQSSDHPTCLQKPLSTISCALVLPYFGTYSTKLLKLAMDSPRRPQQGRTSLPHCPNINIYPTPKELVFNSVRSLGGHDGTSVTTTLGDWGWRTIS